MTTIKEDSVCEKDEDLLEMTLVEGKESREDFKIKVKTDFEQKHLIERLIQESVDILTDISDTSTLGEHKLEHTTADPI